MPLQIDPPELASAGNANGAQTVRREAQVVPRRNIVAACFEVVGGLLSVTVDIHNEQAALFDWTACPDTGDESRYALWVK
ncbi:MAG TPA: hypothetical protein VEF06_13495 [Bryobacteraceae bacterium]|nr:hypothetical protein [Bryobacteraceae bacterium]